MALLLETVAFTGAAIASTTVYLVSYAFCQFLIAFAKDLKQNIIEFNIDIMNEPRSRSAKSYGKLENKLCEIIQFHGDAKQ